MMSKSLITAVAAMLIGVSSANAAVYKFTFQSNDAELMATGEITVKPPNK